MTGGRQSARRAWLAFCMASLVTGTVFAAGAASLLAMDRSEAVAHVAESMPAWLAPLAPLIVTCLVVAESTLALGSLACRTHFRVPSLILLLLLSAGLVHCGLTQGWSASCHCTGLVAVHGIPIALGRNVLLVGLLAWCRPPASTADGPVRPRNHALDGRIDAP